MKLPNAFATYEENFAKFVMNIDSDVKLLYDNIESHLAKNEYRYIDCHLSKNKYRCIDCYLPFATFCVELYTECEPDPP